MKFSHKFNTAVKTTNEIENKTGQITQITNTNTPRGYKLKSNTLH